MKRISIVCLGLNRQEKLIVSMINQKIYLQDNIPNESKVVFFFWYQQKNYFAQLISPRYLVFMG